MILDRQTDRQTHTQARIRRHRAPPSCVAAARRVSRQQRAAAARVAAARVAAAAACCVLQRTRRRERERIFAWKRRAAHGARAREHIVCSRAARAARAARLHEEKRACVCTVRVFVCVSCACVCACAVSVCVCVSQPALAAANALVCACRHDRALWAQSQRHPRPCRKAASAHFTAPSGARLRAWRRTKTTTTFFVKFLMRGGLF